MRGLKGKVAIVAGAAPSNIGAATAVRLAEEGMSVRRGCTCIVNNDVVYLDR